MEHKTESNKKTDNKADNGRLLSLDALRGFDMLFIMGGAGLLAAFATLWPSTITLAIGHQMYHVGWHGLAHHDTIFPLFLFIAGISFPYSLAKQRATGKTQAQIRRKIVTRGIALVLLGMLYNGFLNFDFTHFRYFSVLARIGLGWMFAALLFLNFRTRALAAISALILVGYWFLMMYVPVPGMAGTDPLSYEGNWVGFVDRAVMPSHLLNPGEFDPEGILSTIPAIVTAMLGMLTGQFIREERPGLTPARKAAWLALAGIVILVVGLAWAQVFPINKKLWTSTFVLVVGAYSVLIFALFYYLIDVRGWRRWPFFFKVIGLNSITIYLAQEFIDFPFTEKQVFGGFLGLLPEAAVPVFSYLLYIGVCWGFLYILYRKKIFLKV